MVSNSGRKSGSSAHSNGRKRVVIGATETVRVRYDRNQPKIESERRDKGRRQSAGRKEAPAKSRAGRRLSNVKREERERRQQILRVKRVGAAGAAFAVLIAVVWGLISLYTAPIFVIEKVNVSGNDHLTDASVIASAAVPPDATLVRVSVKDIERRLASNPWIQEVRVSKDYPNALNVTVVEREPALAVDAGGKEIWVVSKDGHWLGLRSAEDTGLVSVLDLPKTTPAAGESVELPELKNAVRVYWGVSPELRELIRAVSAPSVEKTALLTKTDVEVFVGDGRDLKDKDRIVREILTKEAGKVVYINVRVVERPTWRGLTPTP